MKREHFGNDGRKDIYFGPDVRRDLVLADVIRRALENNDPQAKEDLNLLQLPRALGPLEAEVMEVVWQKGEVSVRDVYQVFSKRREIAYTTILTVLRNLNRKGTLQRKRGEAGYVYYPHLSRLDFVQARVGQIMDILLDQFPGPALSHLLKRIERERG